jgi:formylglycine-generating enzyme required for sulfatase activity
MLAERRDRWARRLTAALLTILLCLVNAGFVDPWAFAQEMPGQANWRMVANTTVLTVEQEKARAAEPGSDFKECASGCPIMIVIPAGKFTMGSPENELDREATEGPRHEVTVVEPFAVSKFEVSFEEWDACVAAVRCPDVPDHWGRGRMPVINVSWRDAEQYVAWLSELTQKEYRLLTEAEWEYAARAGTVTRYFWGDDARDDIANCDGCGSRWDRQQTAPVGSLEPNAFGLYDMLGNVWEWVEDRWHENYDGAPALPEQGR